MRVLKRNELVDTPWKNGGGITRNIAKGFSGFDIAWTLSRADITQNGPFSDFAGMTRVLTVVSGGTMVLQSPAHSFDAALWQSVRFDGALNIRSRLTDGPLTVLNLMFNPHLCDGTVTTRRAPFKGPIKKTEQGLVALHVLSGTPQLNGQGLSIGDTVFADADGIDLHLREGDAFLEIRLDYGNHKDAIRLSIAPL